MTWFRKTFSAREGRPDAGDSAGLVGTAFRNLMNEHLRLRDRTDRDRILRRVEERVGLRPRLLPTRRSRWQIAGRPLTARGLILVLGPASALAAAGVLLVNFASPPTAAESPAQAGLSPSDARSVGKTTPASTGTAEAPSFDAGPVVGSGPVVEAGGVAAYPVAERRWIAGEHAMVLNFPDHSRVELEPGSVVDVLLAEPARALLRLERGNIDVDVEHREGTNYRVELGDYEVRVTGTEFKLQYEPEAEHLKLVMREGSVNVVTPEGTVEAVRAGQSFERSRSNANTALAEKRAASNGTTLGIGAAPRASAGDSAAGLNYVVLAKAGKFTEIVQDALGQGLNAVLSSKPPGELLQLSHAARYRGHTDVAKRVLLTLTTRFSKTAEGRSAQFFLGRISESSGDFGSASLAYEKYLGLEPRGAFAPEAAGRRMVLAQKLGNRTLAERLAKDYLTNFPHGSYKTHAAALVAARAPARTTP